MDHTIINCLMWVAAILSGLVKALPSRNGSIRSPIARILGMKKALITSVPNSDKPVKFHTCKILTFDKLV